MGLENVSGLAMHVILSKSGPTEAAAVACLGKRFRAWASDDLLWAQFCSRELDLTSPLDPDDNPAPSFKVPFLIEFLFYLLARFSYFICNFELLFFVNLSWIKSWLGGDELDFFMKMYFDEAEEMYIALLL